MAIQLIELLGCTDKTVVGVMGTLMSRYTGWTIHRTHDGAFILCVTGDLKLTGLAEMLQSFSVTARMTKLVPVPK